MIMSMPSSSPSLPLLMYLPLLLTLIFLTSTVNSLTNPSDVFALNAFKSTISPSSISPWSCLASWNFSSDPCATPRTTHFICGITCSADSTRVIAITLDPAGYSGPLSSLISNLSALNHLDLSENSFYGPIPPSISSISTLQTLILRSNSFSGGLPPSLSALYNLETLDISRNALAGFLPQTLASLSSLKVLDLSFNGFVGGIPKLPRNLGQLAMKGNYLSGALLETSFQGLNQLEVVELSSNKFRGVLKGWLFLLPSIQQIDLANNSLTSVEVGDAKATMSDLVAVDLGYNQIEGQLPVNFATYPSLSALSIRYNRLLGGIPWEYGKKWSLRRLFLDGNFLNGKVPDVFFSNGVSISGSFGDNCLVGCPRSQQLCGQKQKSASLCKRVYRKRPY
ncbi:polygalacturonase inhibitor 1-like protein [Cinnamomum micranthum f. kanehirae]|uniref:Polygalacturonase inhibitor 1-like protein n=1 Tax=Cinnamomum micranthum f. kanehirae TaxID=337451 RepID=A0A443NSB4_9MAGN|nr:polygalacturonase inhibitor 1-like protein [Cinnamomum micranthum f. kanehirae]